MSECECIGPHTEACQDELVAQAEHERDEWKQRAQENADTAHKLLRERDELREKFNVQWKIVQALEAEDAEQLDAIRRSAERRLPPKGAGDE